MDTIDLPPLRVLCPSLVWKLPVGTTFLSTGLVQRVPLILPKRSPGPTTDAILRPRVPGPTSDAVLLVVSQLAVAIILLICFYVRFIVIPL